MTRLYSVAEIDLMRGKLATIVGLDYTGMFSLGAASMAQIVEVRLRTLMLNGTHPSELDEPLAAAHARHRAHCEETTYHLIKAPVWKKQGRFYREHPGPVSGWTDISIDEASVLTGYRYDQLTAFRTSREGIPP